MTERMKLGNGKYEIVNGLMKGEGIKALRYGEDWRNLNRDNLVLAMYHEITYLREGLEFIAEGRGFDGPEECAEVAEYYLEGGED